MRKTGTKSVSRRIYLLTALLLAAFLLASCGQKSGESAEVSTEQEAPSEASETSEETPQETEQPEEAPKEMFSFVTAHGEHYTAELRTDIPKHDYDWTLLHNQDSQITYEDARFTLHKGIDVSRHQGEIDWQAVAGDGIEFAIIRLAYRGYGPEGNLREDERALENLRNAKAAGVKVGVYVFSQAINVDEALEEAEFALSLLDGMALDLPVVYDPELILNDTARTDHVTGEQFTRNTIAFCNRIREAGYEPMIYSNMYWEAFLFDLAQLEGIPVWYADYEPVPQTPYVFEFWQYTEKGNVSGIEGTVDLDVWFERSGSEAVVV